MMTIIQATAEHLDDLSFMFDEYRQFYRKQTDLSGARKFVESRIVNGESVIFIVKHDNEVAGFVQLYPIFSSVQMKRLWLLNDLFVKNSFRGRGFSKALIDAAKNLALATGAAGLMLETEKTNQVGNALYVATGFHVDDAHHFYYWSAV